MSIIICNTCSYPIEVSETLAVTDEGKIIHAECPINFQAVVGTSAPQTLCKKCNRAITAEESTTLDAEDNLIHAFCISKLLAPKPN